MLSAQLAWVTATLLPGVASGTAVSIQLLATAAVTTGYAVTAGPLPPGITMSTAGLLTGTAGAAGTYNFTVRAQSSASALVYSDRVFIMTIV